MIRTQGPQKHCTAPLGYTKAMQCHREYTAGCEWRLFQTAWGQMQGVKWPMSSWPHRLRVRTAGAGMPARQSAPDC